MLLSAGFVHFKILHTFLHNFAFPPGFGGGLKEWKGVIGSVPLSGPVARYARPQGRNPGRMAYLRWSLLHWRGGSF